jgi:hypothetical protein
MISLITPTFVVIIFFLFFGILIYRFIGATDADVKSFMGTEGGTRGFLIIILLIIFLSTVGGRTFFSGTTETITEDGNKTTTSSGSDIGTQGESALTTTLTTLTAKITHPKLLGLVLILLIGAFAMTFISREAQQAVFK